MCMVKKITSSLDNFTVSVGRGLTYVSADVLIMYGPKYHTALQHSMNVQCVNGATGP